MLRIVRTETLRNEELWWKMETQLTLVFRNRKRQIKFLKHITEKEDLENIKLTEHTEVKRARGNQGISGITILCKWLPEQV